jgi:TRAP-type C4-dicarboxylate transport system permease small subunit
MGLLRRVTEGVARALAILAALGLLVLVGLLMVDLFGRNLFGFTTTFANEWSSAVNGAIVLLAAPYAFIKGDHIRVELLDLLRWRRLRRLLVVLADLLCLLIALYFAYAISAMAWESFVTDRRSTWVLRTPLWIPQSVLALGAIALVLAALQRAVTTLAGLRRGS